MHKKQLPKTSLDSSAFDPSLKTLLRECWEWKPCNRPGARGCVSVLYEAINPRMYESESDDDLPPTPVTTLPQLPPTTTEPETPANAVQRGVNSVFSRLKSLFGYASTKPATHPRDRERPQPQDSDHWAAKWIPTPAAKAQWSDYTMALQISTSWPLSPTPSTAYLTPSTDYHSDPLPDEERLDSIFPGQNDTPETPPILSSTFRSPSPTESQLSSPTPSVMSHPTT